MSTLPRRRLCLGALSAVAAVGAPLAGLSGCSGLLPKPSVPPVRYSLQDLAPLQPAARPQPSVATLLVSPVLPAPGQDSRWMAYQRQPGRLDFYADSEWVDTPARLLAPLLVRAAERSGAFHAVLLAPASPLTDLRLDTELLPLAQDFSQSPSRVRLALRATLVDVAQRRVLRSREFEATALAPTDDAAGGVAATQAAALAVAAAVAAFSVP